MGEASQTGLYDFTVVSMEPAAEGLMRLVFSAPDLAYRLHPGQFLNFEVPGNKAEILRVPLSFAGADAAAGTVETVFAVVGGGTSRLAAMRSGDASTVVGPCGNPWRAEAYQGRSIVVAGGVGITPIVACARLLAETGVAFDAVMGAQTASKLWGEPELKDAGAGEVLVTTDDGTAGIHGFTTQALEGLLAKGGYSTVYTCGPEVMMRGVAKLCAEAGVACQVSMERMMSCGFGACSTCNVALAAGGYASCCKDGPVFEAEVIAW